MWDNRHINLTANYIKIGMDEELQLVPLYRRTGTLYINISSRDQTWSVIPAAIAGVLLSHFLSGFFDGNRKDL